MKILSNNTIILSILHISLVFYQRLLQISIGSQIVNILKSIDNLALAAFAKAAGFLRVLKIGFTQFFWRNMQLKTTNSFSSQTTREQFIYYIYPKLQDSLVQGWQEFNRSEIANLYSKFFEFILAAGFDESEYRKVIPNPAYDNAAKLIGKYFLEVARKYNIQFDEIFPGSFAASQESQQGDIEIRQFQLQAFVDQKPLCLLLLKFPHLHKKFGFPLPPKLEVIEFY